MHEFIVTQLNEQLLVGLLALLMVERGTGIEDSGSRIGIPPD